MNRRILVVAAALALAPAAAFAQQTSGPITVERQHDGPMIAPDFEVGKEGSTTATMAGVYGGWMFDNTLLVGAGGYWQTNRSDSRRMDYGGAVVEWLSHANAPIGFGARALLGGGEATLDSTFTERVPVPFFLPNGRVQSVTTELRTVPFRERTDFVLAEPQADLLVNLSSRLRVRVGAGYRFVGAAHGLDNQLHGATGSVALQIGGSSTTRVSR